MNNIYIFRVDDFTEQDAVLAKKFDKSDKVIFMPNKTGMISYTLFPLISAWKIAPTFMQPIADTTNKEPMLFLLGLQCANCNGNMFIVMKNNPFASLDGCEFETEKGTVNIHVAETLNEILPIRKSRTKNKDILPSNELDNENESENVNEATSDDEEYSDDNYDDMQYDDTQYDDAPDNFIKTIANIQKTTGANLLNKVNGIYDCLKESKDDLLPTLEFQMNAKFDENTVGELLNVLEPYMDSLRELIEE